MSVINDMSAKMKGWNKQQQPSVTIYAEDHAEKLTCSICGKQYVSRGKYDSGICRECQREKDAHCIGGMYDGEKAHD